MFSKKEKRKTFIQGFFCLCRTGPVSNPVTGGVPYRSAPEILGARENSHLGATSVVPAPAPPGVFRFP